LDEVARIEQSKKQNNVSEYGYSIDFHRQMLSELLRHVVQVNRLIAKYKVSRAWAQVHLRWADVQIVRELSVSRWYFFGAQTAPRTSTPSRTEAPIEVFKAILCALKQRRFRRMMKLAERKMLINESPFRDVEFLEERKQRRRPHILTFEEEDRVLAAATPHIRALAVLILETGMRSSREALALPWTDVDFVNDVVKVRESKTKAGERTIPISARCKAELLRWHSLLGPEFSSYVFPNMRNPSKPLKDVRRSWARALKDAGLQYFWIYDLRHTLASRLTQAGVSPLFVAQIIGHSGTSILSTYVRAVDEYRRDAIHKLENLRDDYASGEHHPPKLPNGSVQ
jgi:integrase